MGVPFTSEQNSFIAENYRHLSYSELAERFTKRFGRVITEQSVTYKVRRLGLERRPRIREHRSRFTTDVDSYLLDNWHSKTSAELSSKLVDLFGFEVTPQVVTNRLRHLGVSRGRGYLAGGRAPHNRAPIGQERIHKGHIEVKVAQPSVYRPKAEVVMGYDPRRHRPIFLDGDRLNVVPGNIAVVSTSSFMELVRSGWLGSGGEVLKTGIKLCALLDAIKELEEEAS